MKQNISETTDKEIQDFIDLFVKEGFQQYGEPYVFKRIGVKKGGKIEKKEMGVVFYPEILHYGDKAEVWICGRIDLEGNYEDPLNLQLGEWFLKELETMGLNPFMDEDAHLSHFTVNDKNSWCELKFYLNPDYPEGQWENHTL